MCQKKCCEDKHVDLLLIGEESKKYYVLVNDFSTLCMIMQYSVEVNIFVVIVYKHLVQKKI